jgi:hypothetical protein
MSYTGPEVSQWWRCASVKRAALNCWNRLLELGIYVN